MAGATVVTCGNCAAVLEERADLPAAERLPCPVCGSMARLFVAPPLVASVETKISIGVTGWRQKRVPGTRKRPFIESFSGWDLSRTLGRLMAKERVIDRENDRYHERVTDPETGTIIHECVEPLSDHWGHGDARKKS